MKKLINGIVEFRKNVLPGYREKFARLALEQKPDSLFIACSDSRVVPNTFASTDPGDLFVIRNVGNLIPSCGVEGHSSADESEAAAIEFALLNLSIKHIVVCGHSECGAVQALLNGRERVSAPHLRSWLRHAEPALSKMNLDRGNLSEVNHLSQKNVLSQIDNLKSYPLVQERIARNDLTLHGWWFELSTANVYAYEELQHRFVLIDEKEAEQIIKRFS